MDVSPPKTSAHEIEEGRREKGEGKGGGAEEEGGRGMRKGAAHIRVGQVWNNQLRDLPILEEESSCAG
jgi:hypothetical protein